MEGPWQQFYETLCMAHYQKQERSPPPPQHTEKNGTHVHINTNLIHTITVMGMKYISMFNGKPEFFVYRASIANTEIIILLLFNIIPF